jgi:hypothetical protein
MKGFFVTLCFGFTASLIANPAHARPDSPDSPGADRLARYKTESSLPGWNMHLLAARGAPYSLQGEQDRALWRRLNEATDDTTGTGPLEQVTQPRNDDEERVFQSWLRWRVLSQRADGRYSFAHALNLAARQEATGDWMRAAAVYFFHGRLALLIDSSRCADSAVVEGVLNQVQSSPPMKALAKKVFSLSESEIAWAMTEASILEEVLGPRAPAPWLCKLGGKTAARVLEEAEWSRLRADVIESSQRRGHEMLAQRAWPWQLRCIASTPDQLDKARCRN